MAEAEITVKAKPRFVSRGGDKLAGALDAFPIDVSGRICADVGASTGGFTDCLLQNGAAKVYAIDVGYGQIAYTLRIDPRVVVMERTNVRYVESLPEPVSLVVMDASFISLRLLLPAIKGWLTPQADVIPLIKPQFEAGQHDVGKGGVVRDHDVHARVLEEVLTFAQSEGFAVRGLIKSPLKGPAGNVEFLAWLGWGGESDETSHFRIHSGSHLGIPHETASALQFPGLVLAQLVTGGAAAGVSFCSCSHPLLLNGDEPHGFPHLSLLPIYMIHQYEEHAHGRFKDFVNAMLAHGQEKITDVPIFWVNIVGVWVIDLVALYGAAYIHPPLGLIAAYPAVVNGLLHVLMAVRQRRYNPGLWTSILLLLPIGGYSIYAISQNSGAALDRSRARLRIRGRAPRLTIVYLLRYANSG